MPRGKLVMLLVQVYWNGSTSLISVRVASRLLAHTLEFNEIMH